jgi:hypothetical protein
MTDGDGSHSSEMRLDTCTKGVGLDLFSLGFAFLFVFFFFFFCVCFHSDVYFPTSGASSPEWVKPTAEGGGLFLLVFVCYISLFSRC